MYPTYKETKGKARRTQEYQTNMLSYYAIDDLPSHNNLNLWKPFE